VKIFEAGNSPALTPQSGFRARHLDVMLPGPSPCDVAANGVSFLNQDCSHLLRQVVFRAHAGDLDLYDRRRTRRQSQARLDLQIHRRHILPAISVNKLKSEAGRMPAHRTQECVRSVRAPQKENKCQES
jgi:hypothetical protein